MDLMRNEFILIKHKFENELHEFEKQASTVNRQIFQFLIFSKTFVSKTCIDNRYKTKLNQFVYL